MHMSILPIRLCWLAAAAAAVLGAAGTVKAQTPPMPPLPPYLGNFDAANGWSFEPKLTSALPGDVFVPTKEALEKNAQFPQVQRLFDLWSWQAFLAVNWPTNSGGQPAPAITDYGAGENPAWNAWHESNNIFLPGGATPSACTAQPATAAAIQRLRGRRTRAGSCPHQPHCG
jgi:hypothetical protein